ncbi:LysM peptidoglycan-binding domain-containing protein [Nocardia sp. NBC_00511]|uniref:LysM peptidoglycan-binding domain-containing protein n=1 Tax=Nocardia sp. NBC_00511 TaxID=2903591 RepID=UPI00386F6459
MTDQEKTWPASDKAAIAASAKMVGANDKYYSEIIGVVANLNTLLRALMPPDPSSGKFDSSNTDAILSNVATAMGNVNQSYQGYITEVADAAKALANSYVVKTGDNLSGIAAAHGETWEQLYARNSKVVGSDPNLIQPGQRLALKPSPAPAVPPEEAAVTPAPSNSQHLLAD